MTIGKGAPLTAGATEARAYPGKRRNVRDGAPADDDRRNDPRNGAAADLDAAKVYVLDSVPQRASVERMPLMRLGFGEVEGGKPKLQTSLCFWMEGSFFFFCYFSLCFFFFFHFGVLTLLLNVFRFFFLKKIFTYIQFFIFLSFFMFFVSSTFSLHFSIVLSISIFFQNFFHFYYIFCSFRFFFDICFLSCFLSFVFSIFHSLFTFFL